MGKTNGFIKSAGAVLDYVFDWSAWLLSAESLTTGTTIAAATGITIASQTYDDKTATAWISGGTAGKTYTLTCTGVTDQGRTDYQYIFITVTA